MFAKRYSIVIFLFCLFVGLAITVQISKVQLLGGTGLISINEAKRYEEKLQKVQAEKNLSLQKLSDNESEIERLEKEKSSDNAYLRSIMAEIEQYKMSAGFYDVEGPGILIILEEPVIVDGYKSENGNESVIMYNYDLLISLVNSLKRAGAEAISVNGQRMVATTEFNYVGNTVYINTMPTAPPYIIKAIGDPDEMESLLDIRYGIVDVMKNKYNFRVNIEKSKSVQISRYLGRAKFNYAKNLEDAE